MHHVRLSRSTLSSSFHGRHNRDKRRDTHSVCVACRETGRRARKEKQAETATKQRTKPDKRNNAPRAARREDQPENMVDAERKGLVSRLYAMQVRFQQPSLFSIFSMDGTCANILMRCARGRRAGGCDAGGRNADGRGAGVATTKLKP